MANEVVMPRLGWTMEVGRLVEWLKQDGEAVTAGEPLFTVESDKSVTEVEALDTGILRIPDDAPAAGVELPVGAVLAYLVPPGEAAPGVGTVETVMPAAAPPTVVNNGQPSDRASANGASTRRRDGGPPISPRARRIAAELGVDWAVLTGSGSSGRITERDVRAARSSRAPEPRATPVVRRLAAEQAVDLDRLAASTPGGRVSRADVRAAASADRNVLPDAPSHTEPLGAVRSVVAKRMAESARTVAPVTLTTEADATELVRLRARTKDDYAGDEAPPAPVPTVTDLMVRIVALALADHPEMNASLTDDGIVRHAAAHVGIAVDTGRGLLVPVIRDAGSKSAGQIAAESAGLIERARTGTATPDELRGGTFTVTNLGMYEIDAFTPIVNLPECAILGVGRVVARPVVVDEATDEVAVRKMMALSLTFDHRVVDGAPAARFLRDVKRLVEHPFRWLMR